MYGQKQIIYPDGQTKQGSKTDALDVAAHFVSVFVTYFLVKLVFEESALPWSIGICVLYLAFLGFTAFYIYSKQKSFSKRAILPLCLCIVSAFSIALHGSYTIFFIIPFLFYFSGLFCIGMTDTRGMKMDSWLDPYYQIKAMLFVPVTKLFTPFISTLKNFRVTRSKKYLGLVFGIVCGIPVFFVVAKLLIESDAAFGSVMEKTVKYIEKLISRYDELLDPLFVIPTVIFSPWIISVIFGFRHGIIKEKINCSNTENRVGEFRFVPSSALCGFFGIVSACYVIYLLSQFTYLFGAFFGDVPLGTAFKLSDYARRGFFEMSAVAFINLILIAFGAICSKRDSKGRLPVSYKCFGSFFCVFTMLLIITAMSKMALYITDMGLTEKRIAVSLADIVLFIAFFCILIKLFKNDFPYMKIIMCTFLVFIGAYFLVSPNKLIASYNTNAYLNGAHKQLDADYIANNGEDYYSVISLDKVALSKADSKSAKIALYRVYSWHKDCMNDKIANSINEQRLHKYLLKNEKRIKTYRKIHDEHTYCLFDYPYITGENTLENIFFITLKTEKEVIKIELDNSIKDNYSGYLDKEELQQGSDELYWSYPMDADIIADVTVTLENGEKHKCTMAKPSDNDAHYYTLTDDGKGGFCLVQESVAS